MRTVILVGTDHKFQLQIGRQYAKEIEAFRREILELCCTHKVKAIAEEMSVEALQENCVGESVAQRICAELGLDHQFSDPTNAERYKIGVFQDSDIRAQHILDGWTEEQIEADVRARGSVASDRIREKYWWDKIQVLNLWPMIFICGANHFNPFARLLRECGVNVIEAHQDWEPKN